MLYLFAIAANAATLKVGSSATYSSISSAVAAASDGDTIEVAAGTYAESVDLAGKDLDIVGAGSGTILEPTGSYAFRYDDGEAGSVSELHIDAGSARGFYIEGASPAVSGITLDNLDVGTSKGGVAYVDGGAPSFSDIEADAPAALWGGGFYIIGGAEVTLTEVTLDSPDAGGNGGGIYADSSTLILDTVSIQDATALRRGAGMYLSAVVLTATDVDIDGARNDSFGAGLYIEDYSQVTWTGGEIHDCQDWVSPRSDGGGIYADSGSQLSFESTTFSDNRGGSGAHIFLDAATLDLDAVTFSDGEADKHGGALYLEGAATAECFACTFTNNLAGSDGGALYLTSGTDFSDQEGSFDGNEASGEGGALFLVDGVTLSDTAFINHLAGGAGGAIYVDGGSGTLSLSGVAFDSNTAGTDGGAVYVSGAVAVEGDDLSFQSNSAGGDGGALSADRTGADLSLNDSSFRKNSAGDEGGGVFIDAADEVTLRGCDLRKNTAQDGAGLWVDSVASLAVQRSLFFSNTATSSGGGALEQDTVSSASWTNTVFAENTAAEGAGLWIGGAVDAQVVNNNFLANKSAAGDGGHLRIDSGSAEVVNNIFIQAPRGGAIYADSASTLSYNAFKDNVSQDDSASAGLIVTGDSNLTATDPLLVAWTADGNWSNDDLHLDIGSPCLDGGDPTRFDVDGSSSDIGVYGGADAEVFDADGDGWYDTQDCDDDDSSIYPGATEVPYDSVDQDCDGSDLVDVDGDGFDGDADDCDDSDAAVFPGASETWYDGVDQDCDGASDYDADLDLYDDARYGGSDCDDSDGAINPSRVELWYDGVDQNCDANSDYDADYDGFDSDLWGGTDCFDADPRINTLATEVPYDGMDQDCDGSDLRDVDGDGWDAREAGGLDCDDADPDINPGALDPAYDGIDQDCDDAPEYDADRDGFEAAFAGGSDCDDSDPSIHPLAPETWYDGVDQDCGGDDDFDADKDSWQSDQHGGQDCNDSDATSFPGSWETWYDGVDQDCAGDDDFDRDADGFQSADFGGEDCDDYRPEAYPGAEELRNYLDDDCDGYTEDADRDKDGAIDWAEWQVGSDPLEPDMDGDGMPDGWEIGPSWLEPFDTDLDGVLDVFDDDDDDDGIPSLEENTQDPDGDGVRNFDVDGDGLPNARDLDADNDGYPDRDEGTEDRDFDGVPDFVDYTGDFAGGGCGGGDLRWMALLFGLPLVLRRRSKGLQAASGAAVAALLATGLATGLQTAQAAGVDAHGYQVMGTTGDLRASTRLLTPSRPLAGEYDVAVIADNAVRPLVEVFPNGRAPVLSNLATANLVVSGAPMRYLRLEATLPVHMYGVGPAQGAFMALGDARFGAVVPALAPAGSRPGVAIAPSIWLPTGNEERMVGNPGLSAGGVVAVNQQLGRFGWVANVGARVGRFEPERNLQAGAGPMMGVGAHMMLTPDVAVGLELASQGATGFTSWPVEAMATTRINLDGGLWATAGLGAGLNTAPGASTTRVVLGVGWQQRPQPATQVLVHRIGPEIDPDADRDGDGIKDVDDACPDQAETFDTFEDEDGCPELDGDQDGVPFEKDACPEEPIYPEQDPRYSDGCPKLAELSGDKIVITESIFFREGSAKILRKSQPVLDEVARILIEETTDTVLIEGHTNDHGGAEYNYRLSEDRAQAVMRYLIDAGVPRERMAAQGYGYDVPLVDHGAPEAESINRRVEFSVVERREAPGEGRLPEAEELAE